MRCSNKVLNNAFNNVLRDTLHNVPCGRILCSSGLRLHGLTCSLFHTEFAEAKASTQIKSPSHFQAGALKEKRKNYFAALSLRRRARAKPATPKPNNAKLAGSGTTRGPWPTLITLAFKPCVKS